MPNETMFGNMLQESDRNNTVERIFRPDMPEGLVTITVKGHSIDPLYSPQPYALVVLGKFTGKLNSPQNPDPSPDTSCDFSQVQITNCPVPNKVRTSSFAFEFSENTDDKNVSESSASMAASPATFELTDAPEVVEYECSLTDTSDDVTQPEHFDWQLCSSLQVVEGLDSGEYVFSARSSNGGSLKGLCSFEVDILGNEDVLLKSPPNVSDSEFGEFVWVYPDDDVEFECKLDRVAG